MGSCACVRPCVILFKVTVKMSYSSILKSPGVNQASRHASRQASRQVRKQASRQGSRQVNKYASKQALGRHSVGAMPWRGLFVLWIRDRAYLGEMLSLYLYPENS